MNAASLFDGLPVLAVLLLIYVLLSRYLEYRHLTRLEVEENRLDIPVHQGDEHSWDEREVETRLVSGVAVVASDRFRTLLFRLRNLFGGSVDAYSSLMIRARREAIVRLCATVPEACEIVGLHLTTSLVKRHAVEVVAYGTAVIPKAGQRRGGLRRTHYERELLNHRAPLRELVSLLSVFSIIVWVVYVGAGYMAESALTRISREDAAEVIWGESEELEVLYALGQNDPKRQYLQTLLNGMIAAGPEEARELPPVKLVVLDDPLDIKAFAAPPNYIVVSSGLLFFVESENELAMILGHEAGHLIERHSLKDLGRHLASIVVLMAIFGETSELVSWYSGAVITLDDLSYSRNQERQADIWGLRLLTANYGHAGGATDFFTRLVLWDIEQQAAFLSTHPSGQERIDRLNNMIAAGRYGKLALRPVRY